MSKFGVGVIASAVVLFGANATADNIATIEGYSTGTVVSLDSSPVVTAIACQGGGYTVNGYTYNSWLIFVQDSTGSIGLYGALPGSYIPAVGDAVSAAGTYVPYHQIPEIGSLSNLTLVSTGNVLPTPPVFTIPQLTASTTIPESQAGYVLQLTNVTIYTDSAATIPASGNFPNSNTAFYVKDSSGNIMTMYFWVTFESVEGAMIGTPIPTGPVDITGNVEVYPGLPVEINPLAITAVPVPPPVSSPAPLLGSRTIRIVTYNIDADQDQSGPQYALPQPGLITPYNSTIPYTSSDLTSGGVLEGIGEEIINGDPAQPIDVLALQETTSNTNTVQAIVDGLNVFYAYYGNLAGYAMSPYQALSTRPATGGGPNALAYNTNTVQLLASVPVDPGGTPREVMRYEFAPAGVTPTTNNEFYVYVSHYSAGTGAGPAASRLVEATIIRNDESTNLPANARVLYVGDYNPDNDSGEPGYQTICSNSAPDGIMQGQGVDPLNIDWGPYTSAATNIDWSDPTADTNILFMLTESAGNLLYRDDLQVMTSNVYYDVAGGLQYVPGTFHTFGNNASLPYGSSVTANGNTALNDLDPILTNRFNLPATTLYADLTNTTDHLPVVADYTVPIPIPTRTIRVVTYNIQADTVGFGNPGIVSPTCGLIAPYNGPGATFTTNCTGSVTNGGVLEGIGEEIIAGDPAQPIDVLALQETTSNTITVQPIVNALNAFYAYYGNPAGYAMSPYQATECCGLGNGDGPNALVYNTNTLQLIASVPVDPPGGPSQLGSGPGQSGERREVMRYEFAPAGLTPGTNNEFYVYVTHSLSSTDTNARNGEARIIRNDETSLPANARVLYVGDFNLYYSWEPAYLTILSNTAPNGVMQGGGVDPLNVSVATNIDWGDPTTNPATVFMLDEEGYHLQERCELQMMTSNVYYDVAGGFQYVLGSHHSFGNNASLPYGSSVNNRTNTALNDLDPVLTNLTGLSAAVLLEDLTGASDHLPVVADYTIPVPLIAPVASFTARPTYGVAPLTVNFMDISTGPPTSWTWTDTNGDMSTNKNASFTYANPGVYTVQLIACNAIGCGTNTQSVTVITPFQGWQNQYFAGGNLNASAGPNVDQYGTGMNNNNKFLAGFAGNVPAGYLHIINIATSSTNVIVNYLGASGDTNYVPGIQSRTNVLDFTTGDPSGDYANTGWQDTFQTNILGVGISAAGGEGTGLGTVTNMTDFGAATNVPSRYYRVRVLLP
jgi:PKD repeat protein